MSVPSLSQKNSDRERPPCAAPVRMRARPPGTPTLSLRPPSLTPQTRSVPTAQPGLDASPSGSAALCTHLYVEHAHHTLSVSILHASITAPPLDILPHETTRDWGPIGDIEPRDTRKPENRAGGRRRQPPRARSPQPQTWGGCKQRGRDNRLGPAHTGPSTDLGQGHREVTECRSESEAGGSAPRGGPVPEGSEVHTPCRMAAGPAVPPEQPWGLCY